MNQYVAAMAIGLFLHVNILAFEPGQLSLDSVSDFQQGDAAFSVRHRFYGDITKSEEFFGLDNGANTLLALRYAPFKQLVFGVHHISQLQEYNVRIGWSQRFEWVHTQWNINLFSFKQNRLDDRRYRIFSNVVLQTPRFFKYLRITTNIGYDNYDEKLGAGVGMEVELENFLPDTMTFTQTISLLTEWYSKHAQRSGLTRDNNAFAVGIKFQTYGHHFELLGTNSSATEPRSMMQGSNSKSLHFAFNINRKF